LEKLSFASEELNGARLMQEREPVYKERNEEYKERKLQGKNKRSVKHAKRKGQK
jgi:hypothetical protein